MDEAIVKKPVSRNIRLKNAEKESALNIPPKRAPFWDVKTRKVVRTIPRRATYAKFCFFSFIKKSRMNKRIAHKKRRI
jgi:hypothetical protein